MTQIFAQHSKYKLRPDRVLEVGCGQRAVMPILFAAHGIEAFGIDVEVPTYKLNIGTLLRIVRVNGTERALKSLVRHVLFDRLFFKKLATAFSFRSLPFSLAHIEVMDCAEMNFPDNYFDLLFSFAVLEHVANPESAVRHMVRILRPDGVGIVFVHLFPSLSGGHCLDWQHADSKPSDKVPPWDHLLENRYSANVFLNKLRLQDYEKLFCTYAEVIERTTTREGIGLLSVTPELLLKRYTPEDLTTSGVTFIFRKRTHTAVEGIPATN